MELARSGGVGDVRLHLPDLPGVPREIIERVARTGRVYCRQCGQEARDQKQIYNAERNIVTITVTCKCGTITRNVPMPERGAS